MDERGSLVNLDYVTGIEPTLMKSLSADRESTYEITAYRSGPGADWILVSAVDHETAFAIMSELSAAIAAGQSMVDVRQLVMRHRETAADRL